LSGAFRSISVTSREAKGSARPHCTHDELSAHNTFMHGQQRVWVSTKLMYALTRSSWRRWRPRCHCGES
jgi:hypothetical protein